MENKKYYEVMENCFIFSEIEADTVKRFLSDSRITFADYKAGETVFSGEKRYVSFVLSGTARVTSVKSSSNTVLRILRKGDAFGAATVFSPDDSFISRITAVSAMSVCNIPADCLSEMIAADSRIALNYIVFLSDRIRFLNKKIESFTAGDAEARVANYLSSLPCDGCVITIPVSLSRLALILDLSRASVYRAFDSLAEYGAVKKDGRKIIVTDRNKLAEIGK